MTLHTNFYKNLNETYNNNAFADAVVDDVDKKEKNEKNEI